MGNTFSNPDQVNIEDFKDQVFGTTVFLLSKATNPHLEFRSRDECTSDHLPLPKVDSDNIYEIALSYYNYLDHKGTDKDLDYQIEEYVNKNILNSKENVTRFYKTLIDKLMAKQPAQSKTITDTSQNVSSPSRDSKPVRKVATRSVPSSQIRASGQNGAGLNRTATESNHSYVSRQSVRRAPAQKQSPQPPPKPVQRRAQLRPVKQEQPQSLQSVPQHTYQQRSQAGGEYQQRSQAGGEYQQRSQAGGEYQQRSQAGGQDRQDQQRLQAVGQHQQRSQAGGQPVRVNVNVQKLDDIQSNHSVRTTGTTGTRGTQRTQGTVGTTRTQRTNRTTKSVKNGTRAPPPSPKVKPQVPRVSQEFQLAYPKPEEVIPVSYAQAQQVQQGGQGDVASNYTAQSQPANFGTCLLSETDSLVRQPKTPIQEEAPEQLIAQVTSDQEEYAGEEEYVDENEPVQEEVQPQVSYEEYDGDELEYEEYDTLPEH